MPLSPYQQKRRELFEQQKIRTRYGTTIPKAPGSPPRASNDPSPGRGCLVTVFVFCLGIAGLVRACGGSPQVASIVGIVVFCVVVLVVIFAAFGGGSGKR